VPDSLVLDCDTKINSTDILENQAHLIENAGHFVDLELGVAREGRVKDSYELTQGHNRVV